MQIMLAFYNNSINRLRYTPNKNKGDIFFLSVFYSSGQVWVLVVNCRPYCDIITNVYKLLLTRIDDSFEIGLTNFFCHSEFHKKNKLPLYSIVDVIRVYANGI